MSDIVLLDTSVYLNVLDVPGFNQHRDAILDQFNARIQNHDYFLLPMATIWETGNHIAHIESGGYRRKWAELLYSEVNNALIGNTPYKATYFPDKSVFLEWLADFPNFAQRNKTDRQTREGVSLSDLSIIKEWEQTRDRHSMSRVLIWSLDRHLIGYDTGVR